MLLREMPEAELDDSGPLEEVDYECENEDADHMAVPYQKTAVPGKSVSHRA